MSAAPDFSLLRGSLRGRLSAWWLFGSHARGEATALSDIDVLQVSDAPALPYTAGPVQVTVYTAQQLRRMAESGSLFAYHLVTVAKVGDDDTNLLDDLRRQFRRPRTYAGLRSEISSASVLLDASMEEFGERVESYASTARYLLRSYVYSILMDREEMTFSWSKASMTLDDPRLLQFPREAAKWSYVEFEKARELVWEYCGARVTRDGASIQAVLSPWFSDFGSLPIDASFSSMTYSILLGMTMVSPSPESLLILGDVHGNYTGLRAALQSETGQSRHVVLLGDLVNGGLATRQCLELVCARREAGLQTTLLMGNHERAVLTFLRGGSFADFALTGGLATLASYVGPTRMDARTALEGAMSPSHRQLLESAPLFWEAPGLLLSHMGPDPQRPWSRDGDVFARAHPDLFSKCDNLPFLAVCGHYHRADRSVFRRDDLVCLAMGQGTPNERIGALAYPECQLMTF
jgi:serine/threonine protein phosphatase 1